MGENEEKKITITELLTAIQKGSLGLAVLILIVIPLLVFSVSGFYHLIFD